MLKNRGNGWATFHAGDFTGSVSYITPAPLDLLTATFKFLKTRLPQTVEFDEEGSSFLFILNNYCSYVIAERDAPELYLIDRCGEDLVSEILHDIREEGLDNWASSFCTEPREYERLKNGMKKKLKLIDDLLGTGTPEA